MGAASNTPGIAQKEDENREGTTLRNGQRREAPWAEIEARIELERLTLTAPDEQSRAAYELEYGRQWIFEPALRPLPER